MESVLFLLGNKGNDPSVSSAASCSIFALLFVCFVSFVVPSQKVHDSDSRATIRRQGGSGRARALRCGSWQRKGESAVVQSERGDRSSEIGTRWRGRRSVDLGVRISSFFRHLAFDIRHCSGRLCFLCGLLLLFRPWRTIPGKTTTTICSHTGPIASACPDLPSPNSDLRSILQSQGRYKTNKHRKLGILKSRGCWQAHD